MNPRTELNTLENDLGGRNRLDFGTVRPRVQIPRPRPNLEFRIVNFCSAASAAGAQAGHRFLETLVSPLAESSGSPANLNSEISDGWFASLYIS